MLKKAGFFFGIIISLVSYSCEISNPFSYGTGHYAGFEWAKKKNVSSCGGNSTSFIEGCERVLKTD